MKTLRLREMMTKLDLSPEALSKCVPISNMTIRRLLLKKDQVEIPRKYADHFEKFMAQPDASMPVAIPLDFAMIDNAESHLIELSKTSGSSNEVKNQLKDKIQDGHFDRGFLSMVKDLNKWAFQKDDLLCSMIAIGALVYFINPFDFVPDHLIGIGYLDDIGMMSFALLKIKQIQERKSVRIDSKQASSNF